MLTTVTIMIAAIIPTGKELSIVDVGAGVSCAMAVVK